MSEFVTLLFPFFALILLGFAVGRLRLITADGLAGLNVFILHIALPVLFFSLLADTPIASFASWSFVASTTFATYCAFAIAFSIGALRNGGNVPEATVEGVVGSFSGTLLLAPVLVLNTLGVGAGAPMALIASFDLAMLLIVTPPMMALGGTQRSDWRKMAAGIVRRVVTQPIIVATALGFAFAYFAWPMPFAVETLLSMLRTAAGPAALFLFGVSLALSGAEKLRLETPLLLLVKLIVHPAIVYLLLAWVDGFQPLWVHTAVLLAALPPAVQSIRWAESYGVYVAGTRGLVFWGGLAAIVTVTATIVLLVDGGLPTNPFH